MKKMNLKSLFLLGIFLISGALYAQSDADKIVGKWLNEEKDGKVEIYKKGDKYFGKIVWLKNPNNDDGTPKLDVENPDEKLKSRALQGMEMLHNFVYNDDETRDDLLFYVKGKNTNKDGKVDKEQAEVTPASCFKINCVSWKKM